MPQRPCLTPDCRNLTNRGPRCTTCERDYQRHRNANRPQYAGTWDRDAKAAIANYRAQHGDVCPGWDTPPHPIHPNDWACDHDIGPCCIRCNGRKGGSHDRRRAATQRNTANLTQH